jgi:tRNA threonylcarbamoyladenosine biosynthesis protein TsaE
MPRTYRITIDEGPALAKKLAKKLRGGEILALIGPLGAGKTTFAQTLGKALGIRRRIISPTFILMQQYRGRLPAPNAKPVTLYHLDLYRTKDFREARGLGLTELWHQPDSITIIEWADRIKTHLPPNTIYIHTENPHPAI